MDQHQQQGLELTLPPSAPPAGTAAAWAQHKQARGQTLNSWRVWVPGLLVLWTLFMLVGALAAGSNAASSDTANSGNAFAFWISAVICLPLAWRIARRDPQQRLLGLVSAPPAVKAARRQVAAETKVAAQLQQLTASGWIVRHDLHPAGWDSPHNVDHLVVGPPGVVLIGACANMTDTSGFQTLDTAFDTCVQSQPSWSRIYRLIVPVEVSHGHTGHRPLSNAHVRALWSGIYRALVPLEGGIADQKGWNAHVEPLSSLNQYLTTLPAALLNSEQIKLCAAEALWELDPNNAPPPAAIPLSLLDPAAAAASEGNSSSSTDARWDKIQNAPERQQSAPAAPEARVDLDRLQAALERLDELPGLSHVADQVRSFARRARIDEERQRDKRKVSPFGAHFVFAGPPGTGKTMIARQMAEILFALGRLPRASFVETNRAGMVAGYIGQTATQTRKVIESALGGVLFIDEAYALSRKNYEQDFGHEAVAELLEQMETHRDDLSVIIAGYENEIDEFLETNPGLRSRFSRTINFPDYDAATCVEIARKMAADGDYVLTDAAVEVLGQRLASALRHPPDGWANARTVRQIFDDSKQHQADRVIAMPERTSEDRETITASDITAALEERGF